MKKRILLLALLAVAASSAFAQKDAYRRSSLYSMMIVNPKIEGSTGADKAELEAITKSVPKLFEATPIPDKYDDHNVGVRAMLLDKLPKADAQILAAVKDEKGGGNLLEKFGLGEKLGLGNDNDNIARILTHLKNDHVAQKMIHKWWVNNDGSKFSQDFLLQERAMNSFTAEEQEKYSKYDATTKTKILDKVSDDLINKSFVMVNVYSYKSAETIKELLHGAIVGAAAQANALVAAAANKAFELATKNLKGYMCCYKTYLFRVNYNLEDFNNNWFSKAPADFLKSDFGDMAYVGKTSGWRIISSNSGKKTTDDVLKTVTARMIDKSVAQLQKKYEEFKTLSTLRLAEDGKTLIAYIGKKEGLKGGEKFEVLEKLMDEDGNVTYKKIGNVQAVKGKVWNNLAGADNAEIAADEDEDDSKGDAVNATEFKGNAKKFANCLIRQLK